MWSFNEKSLMIFLSLPTKIWTVFGSRVEKMMGLSQSPKSRSTETFFVTETYFRRLGNEYLPIDTCPRAKYMCQKQMSLAHLD